MLARYPALAALALPLLWPATTVLAQAESEDESFTMAQERVERARFVFGEGVTCIEQEDWTCAERHMREVMELRDAPTVRYNLALALYGLNRYPEAGRLLPTVLADPETDSAIADRARELQRVMDENAGRITVMLGPNLIDARVHVDDEAIPPEQGTIPLSAGTHRVSAHRGEEVVTSEEVEVVAGQTQTVELEGPAPVLAEPEPEPPADPDDDDLLLWGLIAGGSLVAAAAVIIIIVAATSTAGPIMGNYQPGVLRWD